MTDLARELADARAAIAGLRYDLASVQANCTRLAGYYDTALTELAEVASDARVLAHAYEHGSDPPAAVVARSLARKV